MPELKLSKCPFFVMELKLSKCLFCNGAQALNVKNLLRSSSSGLIKLGQNHLTSTYITLKKLKAYILPTYYLELDIVVP